jgi:hypothetical protein
MSIVSRFLSIVALTFLALAPEDSVAQPAMASEPVVEALPLFAVQVRTGPTWDASKPPHEQLHFRDHSANLKRLRDAGHLIVGARYSDLGLIILAAESEAQVRSMMDGDPSFGAGIFRYEVHPFNVFYPGTLKAVPRKTAKQ